MPKSPSPLSAKAVALLGSTGSIGINTLRVIEDHLDRFQIVALAAGNNAGLLIEQALRFQPEMVAIYQEEMVSVVKNGLAGTHIRVLSGKSGIIAAAQWPSATLVVSAIVGAAGLEPTWAALQEKKDIALANKECLVMAGTLFMKEVAHQGVRLIPVDSEHSAIFQALFNGCSKTESGIHSLAPVKEIRALTLTASGGPFRGWSRQQLQDVTPEMALAHPSWKMGQKISIDSATMMNKGLEVIEAFYLFGIDSDRIRVVVHPESIVHSMVSYGDGSVIAQMGVPDMRTPIAVALAWPERIQTDVAALDLAQIEQLHFYPAPNPIDFPCLELAYHALRQGGMSATVLNAANEIAVDAFLKGKITFMDISRLIEWAMEKMASPETTSFEAGSIEEILHTDRKTRREAEVWVTHHGRESD